jgi:YidC/Oxa1 family membrane protein insertase
MKTAIIVVALMGALASWASDATTTLVETESVRIRFDAVGRPLEWVACLRERSGRPTGSLCRHFLSVVDADHSGVPAGLLDPGEPVRHWREDGPERMLIGFESVRSSGERLRQTYELTPGTYGVRYAVEVSGVAGSGSGLHYNLSTDSAFRPSPMPGFSAGYAGVRRVRIDAAGETRLDDSEDWPAAVESEQWAGVRSRFWALLASPSSESDGLTGAAGEQTGNLTLTPRDSAVTSMSLTLYSGPVDRLALSQQGGGLSELLFAHLWWWLKPVSSGLLLMLDAIQRVVGNAGLAIMTLSVAVKLLMWPVTRLAERLQARVDQQRSILQPAIDKAKEGFRGEERHERILAVYRDHGISPWYPMKSLIGYAIQIPVFIAAFAMLGENIALSGVPWLWVEDLARPDALVPMPFHIPFFGGDLNLLPWLMTLLTVVAAAIHQDPHLNPVMLKGRRRQLYFLAALFLVLFYTFPAAMVLYWTTNNLLHLVGSLLGRTVAAGRA